VNAIVRLIRDDTPEYPWDESPRAELWRRIDFRWRSYCLTQAAAAVLGALAGANSPFTSRKDRRESCLSNLRRGRDYLGMAAKQ
jgi:anti-sigma-K factor RskA